MHTLLKPLVVSWGYESETPGGSTLVDHNEWWGTRDIASFLSVPAAIQFQRDHDWEAVRRACHELAREAQAGLCDLTGLAPLHSRTQNWFCQMVAAPLPAETDVSALKTRLYDEYRVEVPLSAWQDLKMIRVSIQGYNSKKDIESLLNALSKLLPH